MSYDGVLSIFGLSQFQIEMVIVCGVALAVVGFFIVMYWHFLVAGAVLFGVITIFAHHPTTNEVVVVKQPTPTVEETLPPVEVHEVPKDPDMQKTSIANPLWFLAGVLKDMAQSQPKVEEKPQIVEVKAEPVIETDEMREYVKTCTDLTNNAELCKDNWLTAAKEGEEIVLEPVDRKGKKHKAVKVNADKVQVVKKSEVPQSRVTEVKLLDVDNKEYKERRAAALAKPGAIVMRETYH